MSHRITLVLVISLSCFACGGESPSTPGEGCTTDDQCKGDRICVDKQCVDPEDSMGGGSEAGAAAGSGGSGGAGGSGGSAGKSGSGGVPDDPELEEACMKNCEARQNASCTMNIGSLDQCRAQCLVIDEQNYGYCLDEQTAQYACLASGGYTCVSGYPQQKSTCVTESQALATCNQKAPCRRFCEKAQGTCAPAGDACLTTCLDAQKSFSDAICNVYYTQLVSCWGQSLSCNGDIPAIAPCGPAAAQVADCVARRNHACDGFCWLADALGCGSDSCVSSCKTKADEVTCGRYYRSLVECAYRSNATQLTCEAGEPTPTSACNSERDQYMKCMNPT